MEDDQHCPELAAQEDYVPTALRSPYPGWLRNYGFNGWLNRWNPRQFKAAVMIHQIEKREKRSK